jgi:hypothetical protein
MNRRVAVVADSRDRETTHDHHVRRRDQHRQPVAHLVGGDGERAGDVGELAQRREQRHGEGRVAR